MQVFTIKGTATEMMTTLAVLTAAFGGKATLGEIATAIRYGRVSTAVRLQMEDIVKGE